MKQPIQNESELHQKIREQIGEIIKIQNSKKTTSLLKNVSNLEGKFKELVKDFNKSDDKLREKLAAQEQHIIKNLDGTGTYFLDEKPETTEQKIKTLTLLQKQKDALPFHNFHELIINSKTLTKLDLSGFPNKENKIGINNPLIFFITSALLQNERIDSLDLSNNSISYYGASSLADLLKQRGKIKSLNLSNNQIGDNGALILAMAIESNLDLEELNIEDNNLSDKGRKYLVKALLVNEELRGKNTKFQIKGLSKKHIAVANNTITTEERSELKKRAQTIKMVTSFKERLAQTTNSKQKQKLLNLIEQKTLDLEEQLPWSGKLSPQDKKEFLYYIKSNQVRAIDFSRFKNPDILFPEIAAEKTLDLKKSLIRLKAGSVSEKNFGYLLELVKKNSSLEDFIISNYDNITEELVIKITQAVNNRKRKGLPAVDVKEGSDELTQYPDSKELRKIKREIYFAQQNIQTQTLEDKDKTPQELRDEILSLQHKLKKQKTNLAFTKQQKSLMRKKGIRSALASIASELLQENTPSYSRNQIARELAIEDMNQENTSQKTLFPEFKLLKAEDGFLKLIREIKKRSPDTILSKEDVENLKGLEKNNFLQPGELSELLESNQYFDEVRKQELEKDKSPNILLEQSTPRGKLIAVKQMLLQLASQNNLHQLIVNFDEKNLDLKELGITDHLVPILTSAISQNPKITSINLQGNLLTDIGIDNLASLIETSSEIKSMDLSNNPNITLIGLKRLDKAITRNKKLPKSLPNSNYIALTLDQEQIKTFAEDPDMKVKIDDKLDTIKPLIEKIKLTSTEKLDSKLNLSKAEAEDVIYYIKYKSDLTEINLQNIENFTSLTPGIYSALAGKDNLESLIIGNLEEKELLEIANVTLTKTSLKSFNFEDIPAENICEDTQNQLANLILERTLEGKETVTTKPHIDHGLKISIEEISIDGNHKKNADQDFRELADTLVLDSLKKITLTNFDLNDQSVEKLSYLIKNCKNLKKINLGNNSNAAEKISTALKIRRDEKKLTSIDITPKVILAPKPEPSEAKTQALTKQSSNYNQASESSQSR